MSAQRRLKIRRYLNLFGVHVIVSYGEPLLDADEYMFDGWE